MLTFPAYTFFFTGPSVHFLHNFLFHFDSQQVHCSSTSKSAQIRFAPQSKQTIQYLLPCTVAQCNNTI